MQLFRSEAVAHQRDRLFGAILLAQPVSYFALTAFLGAVVCIALVVFLGFSVTRTESVAGVLLPPSGVVRLFPAQGGLVVERRVSSNQHVQAGDILFAISVDRSSLTRGDVQASASQSIESRIRHLREELKQQQTLGEQRAELLEKKQGQLRIQLTQLDAEMALQVTRVDLARAKVKRFEDLRSANFISDAQVQEHQTELIDQQARLASLVRTKAGLTADYESASTERRDAPIDSAKQMSAIMREIEQLEQDLSESEARRKVVVTAPVAGVISGITVGLGQMAPQDKPLAQLIPEGANLEAELYAPSRAIGFVKPGVKVLLRYQAFPYQAYGQSRGVVTEVSDSALDLNDLSIPIARDKSGNEPVYRIRVALEKQTVMAKGKELPLKAGMQLEASLLLDRRRLYEWILDPLFTVTGRV